MRFHRVPLKLGNMVSDCNGTNTNHGICRSTHSESCLRVFHIDVALCLKVAPPLITFLFIIYEESGSACLTEVRLR